MHASGYGGICIEYVSLNKKINVLLTYMVGYDSIWMRYRIGYVWDKSLFFLLKKRKFIFKRTTSSVLES